MVAGGRGKVLVLRSFGPCLWRRSTRRLLLRAPNAASAAPPTSRGTELPFDLLPEVPPGRSRL